MFRTVVYEGENPVGDVQVYPQNQQNLESSNGGKTVVVLDHLVREKRIRVASFSATSERCPPLAVLFSISAGDLCLKMESNDLHSKMTPLGVLHSKCLRENKTAVVMLGDEELHLVAMQSRRNDGRSCFWGFSVMSGLYDSCLVMLNLRCLGIVFDLDETLVVANTMRSFEDRIDSLQRKVNVETDQQRIGGMVAEIKRYQNEKAMLKLYIESDQVVDNGEVIKAQSELVPALSETHQSMLRPLIRLIDKNIVLTRINPMIRDTSVLVRLRPAWEELRSYLTARGRKRFEVYVCTMAERDYALEMWRLLDPESNLISTNELLDRIVCVKPGLKKSLVNVFHKRSCHPKMALVIDDRLKVWDEKDQSRVHVVPAFAPYYAPQAEANNVIPVLCVARNVACNVRGGFFKEFDDELLQLISVVLYEDDLKDIPFSPDVSNYLVPEDDTIMANVTRETTGFDGMADAEVERRLKEAISSSAVPVTVAPLAANPDPRAASSLHFTSAGAVPVAQPIQQLQVVPFPPNQLPQPAPLAARSFGHIGNADPSLQASPAREEGEVPESELDPDTRRRLLILQHGQDTRDNAPNEPQFGGRTPVQASTPDPGQVSNLIQSSSPPPPPPPGPRVQSRRGWFEDPMNSEQPGRAAAKEYHISDGLQVDKQCPPPPPFPKKMDNFIRSERGYPQKQRFQREGSRRDDNFRSFKSFQSTPLYGEEVSLGRSSSSNKNFENESSRSYSNTKDWDSDSGRSSIHRDSENEPGQNSSMSETPAEALRDIARKCGAKVEYRSNLVTSTELKFLMEVSFAGEKVGEGKGETRREAQHYAAEASLLYLAESYMSHRKSESSPNRGDIRRMSGSNDVLTEEPRRFLHSVEVAGSHDGDGGSQSSLSVLKELCMAEGIGLDFKVDRPKLADPLHKDEVYAQVELDGQVFSRGAGLTLDEAKIQAAEKALSSLKSMLGYSSQKRPVSPRTVQGMSSKRSRPEFSRSFQRYPSSRYSRNASPVP